MSGGWSGTGSFSISVDMSANDAAGIPIVSSAFSNQTDEIKAGINACLTKNGENTPSADLPMGTRKHLNVGKAVAVTNYVRAQEFIEQKPVYLVDQNASPSSVSISCSAEFWAASATAGMFARVKMAATKPQASAAEVELIVNGVTVSAVMPDGGQVVPGALLSGHVHNFVYDGSKARLQNPYVALKKYVVPLRVRGAADASVTVSASVTVTMLAGVHDDMLWIGRTGDNATQSYTFQQSTGRQFVWSAVPSYLFGDVDAAAYGQMCINTSADVANPNYSPAIVDTVRASNRIRITPINAGNIGSAAILPQFLIALPRRKL